MSCGVGCRCGSYPALLWYRPAAIAPVRPLAWEPPYAASAALERQIDKKNFFKSLQTITAGEGVEKKEPSYTVDGNINWYNHYGQEYGGPFEN